MEMGLINSIEPIALRSEVIRAVSSSVQVRFMCPSMLAMQVLISVNMKKAHLGRMLPLPRTGAGGEFYLLSVDGRPDGPFSDICIPSHRFDRGQTRVVLGKKGCRIDLDGFLGCPRCRFTRLSAVLFSLMLEK
jgi:hypothetical protein